MKATRRERTNLPRIHAVATAAVAARLTAAVTAVPAVASPSSSRG